MSDMVPEVLNAALDSLFTPKEPGEREYQGEDGLLYCRNCHTPVQCRVMVGGDIEVTYPFEDEVAIILNESGKINGLPLNRAIYTEDGDMQDIYAGDFLVVGLTEDDFGSLTSEQMQKFEEQFHQPQMFVRMGRSIMAIPVPDDMVKKMEEKAAKPQEKSKPAPDRDSL